jgi:hypothetical protein
MRLVVYDDSRLGVLREGTVVDVSDLVGAGPGEWPPVFLVRAIAAFGRLRPRLVPALAVYGVILLGIGLLLPEGVLNYAGRRARGAKRP